MVEVFDDKPLVLRQNSGASPPPLPRAALDAAKLAITPLPNGDAGHPL